MLKITSLFLFVSIIGLGNTSAQTDKDIDAYFKSKRRLGEDNIKGSYRVDSASTLYYLNNSLVSSKVAISFLEQNDSEKYSVTIFEKKFSFIPDNVHPSVLETVFYRKNKICFIFSIK